MNESLLKLVSGIVDVQRECAVDKTFVLVDENTERCCLQMLSDDLAVDGVIVLPAGDGSKNLASLTSVWLELQNGGATRSSLLINLGGGMVTDIGGFAAATFKRGMRFVNVPTTVLAAVDAASGGKTGINFNDYKNEIGCFAKPERVLLCGEFFKTLSSKDLLSGYAEMVKHGLIDGEDLFYDTLAFDVERCDEVELVKLIERSCEVKERIVAADPQEKGVRRVLNFGHTIGHAIETVLAKSGEPVPHGYAVMWGLMGELYLSCKLKSFPKRYLADVVAVVKEFYGRCPILCKQYDAIIDVMGHDKKNSHGEICFVLFSDISVCQLREVVSVEDIREALDYVREG